MSEHRHLLGAGRRNDEELAIILSVDQGLGSQSSGLLCLEENKPEVWNKVRCEPLQCAKDSQTGDGEWRVQPP